MRKHTYRVLLKMFVKLLKCLASSGIYTISGWLALLFKAFHQDRKENKGESSRKACMGTLSCGHSPPIYKYFVCIFFIRTLIIMSISSNIVRPYLCDPLGSYISLVNNYINPHKKLYFLIAHVTTDGYYIE